MIDPERARATHEPLRGPFLNVDLAALKTLKLVHELSSLSLAARQLDVDQSSVSYTLKRLRTVFDDPLFVRGKNGIVATDRCEQIVSQIDDVIDGFERMMRPRIFDPAVDEFEAVISLSHAGLAVLMTRLVRDLRRTAPGVRLRFVQSRASAYEALEAGSCDLLIRPMPQEVLPFRRRHLMRDRFVCLVDRNGPLAGGMTLEQYAQARHILISFEGLYRPAWFERLSQLGKPPEIVLDLASTSEIGDFIAGTDLVATVTEELARLCSDRVAKVQAPVNAYQDIYLFWSERTHDAENLKWLRNRIAEMAVQIVRERRTRAGRRGEGRG